MEPDCRNCRLLMERAAELSHLLDQVSALAISHHQITPDESSLRRSLEQRHGDKLSANGLREGTMGTVA